jgi:uncharacterized protein
MRIGFWLLVVLAVVVWIDRSKKLRQNQTRQAPLKNATPANPATLESIVACAHCGLHVPVSEAKMSLGSQYYCSDAHRQLHAEA